MPTLCIHSRSFLMPSMVILPFIQCHHTRGLALLGGTAKFLYRTSCEIFTCEKELAANSRRQKSESILFIMAVFGLKVPITCNTTIMNCHVGLIIFVEKDYEAGRHLRYYTH